MIQNERPSEDLRVQRTRKLIQDALIDLTIQKGFASVTVRDITRHAGVNRATFYRHYQDKFDLLDQYAREVYRLLDTPVEAGLSDGNEQEDLGKPAAGLVKMFEHIRANAKFYRVMLGKNGDPAFAEKIRQFVQIRLSRSLPEALRSDKRLAGLYLSFLSSGSAGVVLWWLEHDMPYTPEEMAEIAQQLSAAILSDPSEQASSKDG